MRLPNKEIRELEILAKKVKENKTYVRKRAKQFLSLLEEMLGGLNFDVLLWERTERDTGLKYQIRFTGRLYKYDFDNQDKIYFYKTYDDDFFSEVFYGKRVDEIDDVDLNTIKKYINAVIEKLPEIKEQLQEYNNEAEKIIAKIDKMIKAKEELG